MDINPHVVDKEEGAEFKWSIDHITELVHIYYIVNCGVVYIFMYISNIIFIFCNSLIWIEY